MASLFRYTLGATHRFLNLSRYNVYQCLNSNSRYLQLSRILLGTKGIEVKMPALSPTMTEGTIVKWLKNEGDAISPGDAICEVQTDKAVVFFEMEEEGILAKILLPENTKDIQIGTLIALMVEPGEDWKDVEVPATTGGPPSQQTTTTTPPPPAAAAATTSTHHKIGPAARNLLMKHSLDPSAIPATGHFDTLLKEDVMKYVESGGAAKVQQPSAPAPPVTTAPPPGAAFVDIPLSNMRRTIAKRLTESKTTIPHAYQTVDSRVDAILKMRKALQAEGIKVSVNDFIIKASALALQIVPEVNSSWDGQQARPNAAIDVSVAVATESGLITPIVKSANRLELPRISETVKALADKAKQGRLKPEEFQGGTFCISNLGMFGIKEFSAVINPPQAAILAVGGARAHVDVNMAPVSSMISTLCYDARVVPDAAAARFLSTLRDLLECPTILIAGSDLMRKAAALQ